jgi:hypothetical protein
MTGNQDDGIVRALAGLRAPAPSADRVERTRSRCHAALAQHRKRQRSLRQERPTVSRFVDAMVLGVLAAYLAGAVSEAVWLGSFF